MRQLYLALPVAVLAVVGCRTAEIPRPASIQVPPSLNQQNVEMAILAALDARRTPTVYDPAVPMAEDEYEKLVRSFLLSMSGRAWMVESREPGAIVAVISRPNRYRLRARVEYDGRRAAVAIVDSEGLDQDADRIHKSAVRWIRKLEIRIQRNLDRLRVVAATQR